MSRSLKKKPFVEEKLMARIVAMNEKGEKKAVKTSYAIMKETGYSGGKVIIDSCYGLETSEQLAALIREEYPEANIRYGKCGALCSFYAEKGGIILAFEIA